MKKLFENLHWVILLCLFLFLSVPSAFAKGKQAESNTLTGYCCYKDNVITSDPVQCKIKGGDFFTSKTEAYKKCKPETVYCCSNGKVSETSPEKCKKYGGTLHKNKTEAIKACQPEDFYCCLNGEIDQMSLERCKKNGGKPYKTKTEAQKGCQPEEIYCCLKSGEIDKMSPERCKRRKGIMYSTKTEVLRKCQVEEIYCCIGGEIRTLSDEECKKRGGDEYATKSEAVRHCGWCCVDYKVFPASPEDCRKRRGDYFFSREQAEKECQEELKCCISYKLYNYPKRECENRKGNYYRTDEEAEKECRAQSTHRTGLKKLEMQKDAVRLPVDIARKAILPDLDIIRTYVNRGCYMTVKVKNIGGPIDEGEHAAATIHLSAGPGQISTMTKLTDIDPGGVLKASGGEITKTTELRITKANQATLVWVDTGHAIVESDEINNGDDAELSCRTPLIWCCARGRVGQVTSQQCKRVNGSLHKTEQEANKACGKAGLRLQPLSGPANEKKRKIFPKKIETPTTQILQKMSSARLDERRESESEPAVWPIQIAPPYGGQIFYGGDTINGRYRITQETEAGLIHFALVSGTPPDEFTVHAETDVQYSPHSKKKSPGPVLPKSIIGSFQLLIPGDIEHSSNYKIIGYHSEHRSTLGGSEPFTIRPLIAKEDRGVMKKLDRSRRDDRILQDSDRPTVEQPEEGMAAQAPPRPEAEYPARITSVNCPIIVNSSLSIHGHDFGRNEGQVDIVFEEAVFSCEITEWSEDHVRCLLPDSLAQTIGRFSQEGVIWLKPARVEEPETGTFRYRFPGSSDESPYYYSGNEGPRHVCEIRPRPASCTGVDLVLNKIEVRRTTSGCMAKAWISQICDGETDVETFYAFDDGSGNLPAGWTISAGWEGPTVVPLESGWLGLGCGEITVSVDANHDQTEADEGNNECSVTIPEGQDDISRTCHPF